MVISWKIWDYLGLFGIDVEEHVQQKVKQKFVSTEMWSPERGSKMRFSTGVTLDDTSRNWDKLLPNHK